MGRQGYMGPRLGPRLQAGARAQIWPSFRLVPLNPCRGRGQARLRVSICRAAVPFAVPLQSQTCLTVNLQGFRIRAPEGWPLCNAALALGSWRCVRLGRLPRVLREPGAAVARQGLRAAGPATGSVPGSARCPASNGQSMRRAWDSALGAWRFRMCGGPARAARPARPSRHPRPPPPHSRPASIWPGLAKLGPQHRDQVRDLPGDRLQSGQRGQAAQVRSRRGSTVYCCHRPVQPYRPARLAVLIGDPCAERIYRPPRRCLQRVAGSAPRQRHAPPRCSPPRGRTCKVRARSGLILRTG